MEMDVHAIYQSPIEIEYVKKNPYAIEKKNRISAFSTVLHENLLCEKKKLLRKTFFLQNSIS